MQKFKYLKPREVSLTRKLSPTIAAIRPGEAVEFNALNDGMMTSAVAAVCKLNKVLGRKEFNLSTQDNGVNYIVTRSFPKDSTK